MNTTYAQCQTAAQKKDASNAASVLDASPQSESLQRKADMANNAAQRAEAPRPNNTGMPDNLKAGIESLSGFSMDDVRVHYNSSKPATVQALAYTQGTDIHVAPGQEKCLPHEAWHVAQQMAGRVSPTTNINGMPVNDNAGLEHEADVMGEKAVQCKNEFSSTNAKKNGCIALQRMSFAAVPLADHTLQWESQGTPWHPEPGKREDELSSLVDLYKKEMLTYIAAMIEKYAEDERKLDKTKKLNFGPHVSVVIISGVWYISVNSDVYQKSYEKDLEDVAAIVFDSLSKCWDGKKEDYQGPQEKQAEAAYIALRWAVSRKKSKPIKIVTHPEGSFGRGPKHVHAEMLTLNTLKYEPLKWLTDEEEEKKLRGRWSTCDAKTVDGIVESWKETKAGRKRVVRVGGTKTPCFDCFYEMGGRTDCKDGYKLVNLTGYSGEYSMVNENQIKLNKITRGISKHFFKDKDIKDESFFYKFVCAPVDEKKTKYRGIEEVDEEVMVGEKMGTKKRVFVLDLFPCKIVGTCRGTLYEKIKGDFSQSDTVGCCDLHSGESHVMDVKDRLVTTMTSEHGPASGTWCFSSASSVARLSDFFESESSKIEQDQGYKNLEDACKLLGVTL